jgi:hypothetical protein
VRCSHCLKTFRIADHTSRPPSDRASAGDAGATGQAANDKKLRRDAVERPLTGRDARLEICGLESALLKALARIGAEAHSRGDVSPEVVGDLGEIMGVIQERIDCFNALRESHASRRLLEAVRRRLARLAVKRETLLADLGRRIIDTNGADPQQVRIVRNVEARIDVLRREQARRVDGWAMGAAVGAIVIVTLLGATWLIRLSI